MTETRPIRILLVDDHGVVRRGLAAFLFTHDDLLLVGEADDGSKALVLCEKLNPDVVIMDLVMPEMDGATATRLIKERFPDIRVIVLTSYKDDKLVQQAMESGATSYLLKNVSSEKLVEAIHSAIAGQPTLAPEAVQALIKATHQAQERHPLNEPLTRREQEILTLMVEGLDNSEIAQRLVVSISTVKFHVSNILTKMNVENRTKAVSVALQQELIN